MDQNYVPFIGENDTVYYIDNDTGEVWDAVPLVPGSRYMSPDQVRNVRERAERAAEHRQRAAVIAAMRQNDKELGQYTLSTVNAETWLKDLKPSVIAKLVYLATFLRYDAGSLYVRKGTAMCKKDLESVLGLSRAATNRVWNELSKNEIIKANDEGALILNPSLFCRGKLPGNRDRSLTTVRFFSNQIRSLYRNAPVSKHVYLGHMFKLVPYINRRYNVLCKNPEETCFRDVEPLTYREVCALLGLTMNSEPNLREAYTNLFFEHRGVSYRFCGSATMNDGREFIFVSPRVLFMGPDWKEVEELMQGALIQG